MASDAAGLAVSAGWPPLQSKLEAEFPKLLTQAESAVVTQLWPQMQPKLRVEMDRAITQANKMVKEAENTAWMIGGAVVAAILVSAIWIKKGK